MDKDHRIVNKRILIVEDERTNLYIIDSLRSRFDEIIIISDYLKPISQLSNNQLERLPTSTYNSEVRPGKEKSLVVRSIGKEKYASTKNLDLGENNAYFVVGKLSWYYLRDFHNCHIGLRSTTKDWQIVHLFPFTMGTNKFVFSHTMTDEHFKAHEQYFFDDNKLLETVKPLQSSKCLYEIDEIEKALNWAATRSVGTNFGLD